MPLPPEEIRTLLNRPPHNSHRKSELGGTQGRLRGALIARGSLGAAAEVSQQLVNEKERSLYSGLVYLPVDPKTVIDQRRRNSGNDRTLESSARSLKKGSKSPIFDSWRLSRQLR